MNSKKILIPILMLISLGFFGMLMGFSSKENVPSSEKNNNPKVKVTEIKNNRAFYNQVSQILLAN